MAKVTIEDISRQTGLSRGTVSRALNDRPDISEQTRQRVLEACRKLNYSPSHAARSLATGRNYALAVLVDTLQSTLACSFLRGVLASAHAAQYAVHVGELGGDGAGQTGVIRAVVTERIDGVLVAAALTRDVAARLAAAVERQPVVAFGDVEGLPWDVLAPDQHEAGRLVARHLLRGGDRRVAYFHAARPFADERLAGFREVCLEHGLPPSELVVELPAEDEMSSQTERIVAGRLEHVSAAGASDDYLALDLMATCWRLGRRPGQDVAIMGQGNEVFAARVVPGLTSVDLCGEEIGRRATETLLQRIDKARMDAPHAARVAPMLIARGSTRSLA